MNSEQAKAIPLSLILENLGFKPHRADEKGGHYFAPWRNEKTPSLHVDYIKNVWYDFGEGEGGNIIDFARKQLLSQNEGATISDALRYINAMSGNCPRIANVPIPDYREEDKNTLTLIFSEKLENPGLTLYLEKRGIDVNLAKRHLKQVKIHNSRTDKSFWALGLKNEDRGYEVRNKFFKGCVGAKSLTFIEGDNPKPDGIHFFEGMMDYLTYLTIKKKHDDHVIVLNSLVCLAQATPYLKWYGYKKAYTWMDNDLAGKKATQNLRDFFKTEEGLLHVPFNKLYAKHKDVNAWHMHNLNLNL